MATSRRRERDLARRRYERRRQAELERRARAKRRNTVLGAVLGTAGVIGVVVALVVTLGGGSSKPTLAASSKHDSSASASPSASPSKAPKAPVHCAKISPNPPAQGQPRVPPVTGKAPSNLVVKDVKVGHGPAAKNGSTLKVDYIGVSCDSGKVFDATYRDGGKPFTVTPLGSAGVIQGWNQGLVGIRAGGVRELVIPASLAYGAQGSGPIKGNDTLIFLVTAKSVKA